MASQCPDIASQWDYSSNDGLEPNMVTCKSNKKVNWRCELGHVWSAVIASRVRRGDKCSICTNRTLLIGFNDLKTRYPDIAKQFSLSKNEGIKPEEVLFGINSLAWWECDVCGHLWETKVSTRVNKDNGCPKCISGRRTSFPEQAILFYMQKMFKDVQNRAKVNGVEVDILINNKIAIEYDGVYWHTGKEEYDKHKNFLLERYTFIRLREYGLPLLTDYNCDNIIVDRFNLNEALNSLIDLIESKGTIFDRVNIDIEADKVEINSILRLPKLENPLTVTHPHLVLEWDYLRNGYLTPENTSSGSNKKVGWVCKNNHHWGGKLFRLEHVVKGQDVENVGK